MDITSRAKWLEDAKDVVGGHHEKFGGSGYPSGLAGKEIPINARIFAIVDVALTSKRPYKDPLSFDETMEILENGRDSYFDLELLDTFKSIARELYEQYGGQDGDKPRMRLDSGQPAIFQDRRSRPDDLGKNPIPVIHRASNTPGHGLIQTEAFSVASL